MAAATQTKMLLISAISTVKEETSQTADRQSTTTIAAMVMAVLSFPSLLAAITVPLSDATSRREVTRNSRAIMIMTATELANPRSIKAISAEKTRILSANGSRNFPKFVMS